MAALGSVEADADDAVAVGLGFAQGRLGFRGREVAPEAEDQLRADAELGGGLLATALEAVDDRGEGHAAAGVALRIEKDLGVAHIVGRGAPET